MIFFFQVNTLLLLKPYHKFSKEMQTASLDVVTVDSSNESSQNP